MARRAAAGLRRGAAGRTADRAGGGHYFIPVGAMADNAPESQAPRRRPQVDSWRMMLVMLVVGLMCTAIGIAWRDEVHPDQMRLVVFLTLASPMALAVLLGALRWLQSWRRRGEEP
jgi:predicted permease